MQFFTGYGLEDGANSVHLLLRNDGRINGDAYVFMKSEDEALRAESEKNGQEIGGRWLQIRSESTSVARQRLEASSRVRSLCCLLHCLVCVFVCARQLLWGWKLRGGVLVSKQCWCV